MHQLQQAFPEPLCDQWEEVDRFGVQDVPCLSADVAALNKYNLSCTGSTALADH